MTIGQIIRHRRKKMQITARAMAKEIGVHEEFVYRWEKDKHTPSLENAITLADFFGCTLDELVGRINK